MKKNKSVPVDTIVKLEYHTVKNYQSTVSVAIYFTKKNAANYVDDQGCKKLGEFLVNLTMVSTGTDLFFFIKVSNTSRHRSAFSPSTRFWRSCLDSSNIGLIRLP
jgi:hypothetical protein